MFREKQEFVPSYKSRFNTKEEAVKNVLEAVLENPACADRDGTVTFMVWGSSYQLKPRKKKKKENGEPDEE